MKTSVFTSRPVYSLEAAECLSCRRDSIIQEWERLVHEQVPAARLNSSTAVRDAIPQFLTKLSRALDPNFPAMTVLQGSEVAKEHGRERATLGHYDLEQVMAEYSVLRRVIIKRLRAECTMSEATTDLVHDAIELSMQEAATAYVSQTTQRLEETNAELTRSNLELSRFAAIAAHDLKAPLNTITQFLDLFIAEYAANFDEEGRSYISFMTNAANRLRALIDRLLSFARVGAEREALENIDLNELVATITNQLKSSIEESGAFITVAKLPEITGSRSEFEQLFQNLLANSLKYRRDVAPEITITALDKDTHWLIRIADNGIGIGDDEVEQIFEAFHRNANAQNYEGTGLGLAICRRVVENHGGRIWAKALAQHGTEFSFTLKK